MLHLVLGWATILGTLAPCPAPASPRNISQWPTFIGYGPIEVPPPPARWTRAAWLDSLLLERWKQNPPPGAGRALSALKNSTPLLLWNRWAQEPIAAFDRLDPPRAARALAYSSVVSYEILRCIEMNTRRAPHRPRDPNHGRARADYPDDLAALSAGQSLILGDFFPDWDHNLTRRARATAWLHVADGTAFPTDIQNGWQIGDHIARAALRRLRQDPHPRANRVPLWALSPDAGQWQTWLEHPYNSRPRVPRTVERPSLPLRLTIRKRNLMVKWLNADPARMWHERVTALCMKNSRGQLETAYILACTSMAMQDAAIHAWRAHPLMAGVPPQAALSRTNPALPPPDHPAYAAATAAIAYAAATVAGEFFPRHKNELLQGAKEASQALLDAGWCDAGDRHSGEALGRAIGVRFSKKPVAWTPPGDCEGHGSVFVATSHSR